MTFVLLNLYSGVGGEISFKWLSFKECIVMKASLIISAE